MALVKIQFYSLDVVLSGERCGRYTYQETTFSKILNMVVRLLLSKFEDEVHINIVELCSASSSSTSLVLNCNKTVRYGNDS